MININNNNNNKPNEKSIGWKGFSWFLQKIHQKKVGEKGAIHWKLNFMYWTHQERKKKQLENYLLCKESQNITMLTWKWEPKYSWHVNI
jgi:hypothetical protein